MRLVFILLLVVFGILFWADGAFAVSESGTLHTTDWVTMAAYIFAPFGATGWLAAVVPVKVRQYIPLVKMLFNFMSANVGNAKNKDD